METTIFVSERGKAEVVVPDYNGEMITVRAMTDLGSLEVKVRTRADAFKLVGMVLGEEAK